MTTTTAQITVQSTADPNVRAYNTRFEMSSSPEDGIRGGAGDLGEFGKLIVAFNGVVRVQVASYVLLVTKAPLFSWDEVEPNITHVLKSFEISQRQIVHAVSEIIAGSVPGIARSEPAKPRVSRAIGAAN